MIALLSRAFNIRPEEWRRLSLLSLIIFLLIVAITWAGIIIPVAIAVVIGTQYLPYLFIGDAILAFIGTAVYSAYVDRVNNNRIFIILASLTVLGVVAGLILLQLDYTRLAYFFLYLLFRVSSDVMGTHSALYVSSFYDTRAAKRIWPFIGSVLRVAVLMAAIAVPIINQVELPPEVIIGLWAGSLALMMLCIGAMARLPREREAVTAIIPRSSLQAIKDSESQVSFIAGLREGYQYVRQSPYLQAMAMQVLLSMLLMTALGYQAYIILVDNLESTASVSDFNSLILIGGSLLILPLQLFALTRIIARLGVGNTNLIYPAIIATIGVLLVISPTALALGGLILFTTGILDLTFRAPADEMLYNAVPVRIKGRARAFITALLQPFGKLIAGLVSLPFLPLADTVWFFPTFIALAGAAYFLGALLMRRRYAQALIKLLEEENYSFLLDRSSSADFRVDAATLKKLEERLVESQDEDFKLFMANVLIDLGGRDAVPILERAVQEASPRLRVGLLDVLGASNVRDESLKNLCLEFMRDPDPAVRRSALATLERVLGNHHREYEEVAVDMLEDDDMSVKAQALPSMIGSNNVAYLDRANKALNSFTSHDDPTIRAVGVDILGQTGSTRIVDYLNDPSEKVRIAAAVAFEEMVLGTPSKQIQNLAVQHMPRLLNDSVERIRFSAIRSLGKLGKTQPDLLKPLLVNLADRSPRVRDAVVDVFVETGKTSIGVVDPLLINTDSPQGKMAAVTLARIDRERYASKVMQSVRGNLKRIYGHLAQLEALQKVRHFPSIQVLQNTLLDENEELLQEIFYMLTAIHKGDAVRVIVTALESEQGRSRANATEALESLVSPQLARLISPLYDPDISTAKLVALGREEFDLPDQALKSLLAHYYKDIEQPWHRVAAAFALGEMGAELAKLKTVDHKRSTRPVKKPAELEDSAPSRRKRGVTSLFDRLSDDKPPAKPAESEEPLQEIQSATTQIMKPVVAAAEIPFTLDEIQIMLRFADSEDLDFKTSVRAARRLIAGQSVRETQEEEKEAMLSAIEKVIFLKGVPFFQGMTVNQLKALAAVTEEQFFVEDVAIFAQGDPGGSLYVVVNGKVGIERRNEAGTASARIKDVEVRGYFGETTLFDNSECITSALALKDTLCLRLDHDPLMALIQEYPDLSLQLIRVLSKRIQESDEVVADLSRRRSRTMHKVFDKLY
jgi:HEAT repeat protein